MLIVEDHLPLRQAFAFMLGREPDLEVVAQAGSLAEARGVLSGVDVAIIDLGLPDGDGAELVRELHAASPGAKALILTASVERYDLARAVEAGAAGLLRKVVDLRDVIDAVRRIHGGEMLFSPAEIAELLRFLGQRRERDRTAQLALAKLTAREREVLEALARGWSDKEIARRLMVEDETARAHVSSILHKLGATSRLQALLIAVKSGAVRIDPPE